MTTWTYIYNSGIIQRIFKIKICEKCNMKKISKLFSLLICIVMMSSLFVGVVKSN